jgi:sulfur carrier protein
MQLSLNDQPREIAPGATLADLLRELGLAERKGLAVAVDDAVVPRSAWPAQLLAEGARVLVIRATQGG